MLADLARPTDGVRAPVPFRPMAPEAPRSSPSGSPALAPLLLAVLDEVNHGLMLVDDVGQVRYANRIAVRDCRGQGPLQMEGQRLRLANPGDRDALLRAVELARSGRRSMLTLRHGPASLSVGVVPVPPDVGDADMSALLVLGRAVSCEPLALQFFAQAHRLTPAECAVVSGLCEGLRPVDVARRCGVALSTIRSQISSIREKTQAKSIDHVVRMIESLPPIVPALLAERSIGPTARPPRRTCVAM